MSQFSAAKPSTAEKGFQPSEYGLRAAYAAKRKNKGHSEVVDQRRYAIEKYLILY